MNISPTVHALALAVFIALPSAHADENSVDAKLSKIPPAAAEALKKAAGTGKIEKFSLFKEGKVTVFEIEITEAGQPNREVSVTADGKLNAEEETVPLDKVPEAARKAIEAGAKGAKLERVQRIKRATGITYEAAYVTKYRDFIGRLRGWYPNAHIFALAPWKEGAP